jgi:hypothetical protein
MIDVTRQHNIRRDPGNIKARSWTRRANSHSAPATVGLVAKLEAAEAGLLIDSSGIFHFLLRWMKKQRMKPRGAYIIWISIHAFDISPRKVIVITAYTCEYSFEKRLLRELHRTIVAAAVVLRMYTSLDVSARDRRIRSTVCSRESLGNGTEMVLMRESIRSTT